MLPLTLLGANKLLNLLTVNDALSQAISSNAALAGVAIASLNTAQIIGSFVNPDMGDLNLHLTYPRVCVYASHIANNQREKFQAFSGVVSVVADLWSSDSLEQPAELALHFFVQGIAGILQTNIGDWGDGFRYSGVYGVQMQVPKVGGLGFVQLARVTCNLDVTFS
jgi:hypothetical protein